jgi:hypothetical protein
MLQAKADMIKKSANEKSEEQMKTNDWFLNHHFEDKTNDSNEYVQTD